MSEGKEFEFDEALSALNKAVEGGLAFQKQNVFATILVAGALHNIGLALDRIATIYGTEQDAGTALNRIADVLEQNL